MKRVSYKLSAPFDALNPIFYEYIYVCVYRDPTCTLLTPPENWPEALELYL